jgi:hypothetical protein
MGRPTLTKEWFPNSTIIIIIKPTDQIHFLKSNTHGNVETNNSGWSGLNATVILGHHHVIGGQVEVPQGVRIWTCVINQRGTLSSICLPNEEVTVIIHA